MLLALAAPDRLEEVTPGAFVRLPGRAAGLPRGRAGPAAAVAVAPAGSSPLAAGGAAGGGRGLQAPRRRVPAGPEPALRPAHRLALRRLPGGDGPRLRRGRAGHRAARRRPGRSWSPCSCCCRSSVLRVTESPPGTGGRGRALVAVLLPLWLVLGLLDVRAGAGPVASGDGRRLRLRPGRPRPLAAARPAGVRPGCGGGPGARRARRRAADRPARQGRPGRLRRELRPGGGRGDERTPPGSTRVLDAGTRRLGRDGLPPRAAPTSPPPPSARSAGWRTRRSSRACGSTASSATTTW